MNPCKGHVVFVCYVQGCCLTGARSPEAPKVRAWATKFRYKEPARAPDLTHGIRLNLLVHYIPLAGVGL